MVPSSILVVACPTTSLFGFVTSKSKFVWNETSFGSVNVTESPSLISIESGILTSLYSTLNPWYLSVPVGNSSATFGFSTLIVVPSFVTVVGAVVTSVVASGVADASASVAAGSVVVTSSDVGSDEAVVTSSADAIAVVKRTVIRITPQRP